MELTANQQAKQTGDEVARFVTVAADSMARRAERRDWPYVRILARQILQATNAEIQRETAVRA